MASKTKAKKSKATKKKKVVPDNAPAPASETNQAPAPTPETAPAPEAKKTKYINVLTIKEDGYKGAAGKEYKGSGLKDADRLAHLIKRGAVKEV